jgi:tolkin protein
LEIRDGQHGYDLLKHKFCGNTFPDIIESSSRYLWLRFKSDDSIEGAGFTAVYESVLPETGEQRERALCLQQTLLQR